MEKLEQSTTINFNDVVIKAPNGEVMQVKDYAKIAATYLWRSAPTIPLYQASLKLHDSESVDMSKQDIELMMQIFLPHNQWAMPFAMFPMLAYLQQKIAEFENHGNE